MGLDLSGPRNLADTSVAVFAEEAGQLLLQQALNGADDRPIFDVVSAGAQAGSIVLGIDAPLSYNVGGGDRPSDRALRALVLQRGRVGIMPPTLIRMVYLTLRGVALTRMLETLRPRFELKMVEVHPGAVFLLRGARPGDVAAFKRDVPARVRLLDWLEQNALKNLPHGGEVSDHFVAACAAALSAWQWSLGAPAWCFPATPPEHPYDFAC